MSVTVMAWVWKSSRADPTDRLVLLAIADAANDQGADAYPSMATLTSKTGLHERSIQRSLKRLGEIGELVVYPNAGPRGCNRYRLPMTPGTESPPAQRRGGTQTPRQVVTPAESRPDPGTAPPPPRQGAGVTPGTAPPEPSFTHPSTILEPSVSATDRADVAEICAHLADRIEANGSKRPKITPAWRTAARLLLDSDGRTVGQVRAAIDWCQEDPFWRSNILSMVKLREKYEQLRLQAQRTRQPVVATTDRKVAAGLAIAAAFEAKELTR